jgi:hypothetical protein
MVCEALIKDPEDELKAVAVALGGWQEQGPDAQERGPGIQCA